MDKIGEAKLKLRFSLNPKLNPTDIALNPKRRGLLEEQVACLVVHLGDAAGLLTLKPGRMEPEGGSAQS